MKINFPSLRYPHMLFILALIVALIQIGFLLTQSIRLDESQTLWMTTKSFQGTITFISTDVHVPLYFIMMFSWIRVFGLSIISMRLLSVVFLLLTLPAMYYLTKKITRDKDLPWFSLVFLITSPFILWYGTEARMYSLFLFVTTLQQFFFIRFLNQPNNKAIFFLFLSTLMGMYTHYFFWLILGTQGLYVLWNFVGSMNWKERQWKALFENLMHASKLLQKFTFVLVTAGIFFLPWIVFVKSQGSLSNTQPQLIKPDSGAILQLFFQFLFGLQQYQWQGIIMSLWPLIVVGIFLFFTKKIRLSIFYLGYLTLVSLVPIVLAFAVSFVFRPIFVPRYLIHVSATFFILFSWSLLTMFHKRKYFVASMFAGLMMVSGIVQNISAKTPVKENYEQVTEYLNSTVTYEDIVAVSSPFTIYPIEYSYRGQAKLESIPSWNHYVPGGLPAFSEQDLEKQIEEYKKQYRKLFVVLSYDQGYEKQIREYLDNNIAFESKQVYSPGLELRVYVLRYDILEKSPDERN